MSHIPYHLLTCVYVHDSMVTISCFKTFFSHCIMGCHNYRSPQVPARKVYRSICAHHLLSRALESQSKIEHYILSPRSSSVSFSEQGDRSSRRPRDFPRSAQTYSRNRTGMQAFPVKVWLFTFCKTSTTNYSLDKIHNFK